MMIEEMDSDLHRVIQSSKPLTVRHHKCFLKQLLEGIKAMHSVGVLHRDLKPGNILVSKDCQLRITDFGLARFMDEKTIAGDNKVGPMTQYVVTRWYRPPELLLAPNLPYGEAVDLWSIGCILAELTNRKALFPGKDHLNQVDLIFNAFGYSADQDQLGFPIDAESAAVLRKLPKLPKQPLSKYVPSATPDALGLLDMLLAVNPTHRPTAEQALQHPFLADAEVLYDYSKAYLTRPAPEYFEFEYTAFTVPELRALIHQEVKELSAEAYHTPSSTARPDPISPGAEPSVSSEQKPIRRRSETDGTTETSLSQHKAAQDALHGPDGPASQLPTVRLQNGAAAQNNESIYVVNRTSTTDVLAAPAPGAVAATAQQKESSSSHHAAHPAGEKKESSSSHHAAHPAGEKKGRDNPFRSTGSVSATAVAPAPVAAPAPAPASAATSNAAAAAPAAAPALSTVSTESVSEETLARAIAAAMGTPEDQKHNADTLVDAAKAGGDEKAAMAANNTAAGKKAEAGEAHTEHQSCCLIQ
jgi:serine/threonine protein kinase